MAGSGMHRLSKRRRVFPRQGASKCAGASVVGGAHGTVHRTAIYAAMHTRIERGGAALPDLGPVLGPLGFCFLPVSCSGPPEPAPRVELAACSD
jgi:hypothetical protein